MKQAISTITVIGLSVLLFIACNSIQEQAPSQVKAPTAGAVSTNDGSVLPFAEPGQGRIERSVPGGHTASETFDVGVDFGSPVALDYLDRAPFKFSGKIEKIHIAYTDVK